MSARARHLPALLVFVAVAFGCTPSPEPDTRSRPNLLLIAVDTLRADHLGTYGYERPTSPEIDRFFETATVFEEALSSSSWTLPSFASLMTSVYPSTHRCWRFDTPLDASFTTLAEVLGEQGWHTAAVVSHMFMASTYGLSKGFADYDESLVFDLTKSHQQISAPPVTQRALAFLDQQASSDDPWFLWLHYFDPHWLYLRHEGISDEFGARMIDLYDGEIVLTDRHIGRVLRKLDELGLADNTIVAFVADHGEEFGDHGGAQHGKTLYREVTRVPFAMRVPGVAASRVKAPVSVVDFMPTILDLLNVPSPETPMVGRSLQGVMQGEPLDDRDLLLQVQLRSEEVRLNGLVADQWKLVVTRPLQSGEEGTVELFDRLADPRELRDVSEEHPGVVRALRERLAAEIAQGEELAARFSSPSQLELSVEELQGLRALGYVGDREVERAKAGK